MLTEETVVVGVNAHPGEIVEVCIAGRLGWETDAMIKERLTTEVGESWSGGTVVLNVEEVRFVDSAGVSSLLSLRRLINEAGGRLVFCAVPPRIRQMFELVGMYSLVPAVDSIEQVREEHDA